MKKFVSVIFLAVLLSSCGTMYYPVAPEKNKIFLSSAFNVNQAQFINKKGNNTLKGESFLKTVGGDVKTCAGNEVHLIPVTDYSNERMIKQFGKSQSGYITDYTFIMTEFVNTDANYTEYQKTTYCNSQGGFIFENLSDGEYYVTTIVKWQGGYPMTTQGGVIMKRIAVKDGETKSVYVLAE